jgi:L-2-hydroxyglutarate oxidase
MKVVVLEKEDDIARHQTGHNSGVIHAGIYYAPGSAKASFCYTGSKMLRRFCDERGVPYEMCGKVIVAVNDDEVPRLMELHRRGQMNGVAGLQVIGPERLREIEPHSAGVGAVYSPETGIVDYGVVAQAFVAELIENGGEVLTGARVVGLSADREGVRIRTTFGEVAARRLINCAGLYADKLALEMGIEPGLRIVPFRGEFFSLAPERSGLVNGLVYPVPDPRLPFLGVHFTKRVDGTVEAGPNAVLAFAREGYRSLDVDLAELWGALTYKGFWRMSRTHWRSGIQEQYRSAVKGKMAKSLQVLVPEVRKDDLVNRSAGVRAQAVDDKGRLVQDFAIVRGPKSIHVLNAPSPAATASLAIGSHIVELAQESLDVAA